MTLRDLSPHVLKKLQEQCEEDYKVFTEQKHDRKFGTHEPLTTYEIFRYAFSKGTTAVLKRVDHGQLKENL